MKKLLFLAALLGCSILLQAQSPADEAAMQAFARNFMNAYNQQDHEAIRKMYLDDAVRIDQDGKEIKGADNIAAYFADQFRQNNATVFIRQLSVGWSDREYTWVAKGTYEVNGKTHVYDIPIHVTGGYANAMIKEDGEWKIAKSMLFPLEHADPKVAANIKMYTETWDRIVNEGRLDFFNAEHFTEDVIMHAEPENVVGIEGMAAFYNNFLTGFSDIEFTINNVFGEGDQLVKHWTFKGTHTGDFFGIPPTGNRVSLDGSTITRMSADGRIAEERDFMDNMALLAQLGVVSAPGNVAVVDGLYQSFAKGDVPAVLAVMDANIVWNEAESFPYADQNPYIGPEAVLNGVFARIGAEWEYWNLTDIQLHDMSNNQVLAALRYKAKHKTTGKTIDSQTAHLWTLKDGKIVAFQQFTDTKQAAEAVR
ncbi:MAG: ester cyclase [Lewinellaceae bacterium]|nr:ester cyclase [Phaeodactylibacter sp.]MCB9040033.1 ester cyclase [Lewinellaceae bacterium]